jgi:hypothetical protein
MVPLMVAVRPLSFAPLSVPCAHAQGMMHIYNRISASVARMFIFISLSLVIKYHNGNLPRNVYSWLKKVNYEGKSTPAFNPFRYLCAIKPSRMTLYA